MFGLEKIASKIEIPPEGVGADLAIPCFREKPEDVAEKIRALNNPLFHSVAVTGRYVNILFDLNVLASLTLEEVMQVKEKYGWNTDGAGKTVMLEYSAPNIAKPLHMGHARNNAIGHALANIYKANGYAVITTNHFGDWGMSLAKIMLAFQKWGDRAAFTKDPIRTLLDLYVRITKEIKAAPELEDEARELFRKLEAGDRALRTLWQEFRDISVKNFERIYALFGINFDLWHGESFYEPFIKEAVDEALAKGAAAYGEPEAIKDGGPPLARQGKPVVVNLDAFKLPSFLLVKSDGASLYSARDIAVGRWRLKEYPQAEKIIYVVGHEQELYLRQIFKTLGLMGYPEEKFKHVSYGVVTLGGKKISTREGGIVFLEDGLKEAVAKTKGIKEVGVGAILYNMLSMGREHDIAFSWDAALSIQGNSAPYIQYAYVRAKAILEKAGAFDAAVSYSPITAGSHEANLLKRIAEFPQVVKQAYALDAPHIIATFLNEFAQEFSRFYDAVPVLEEGEARALRLALVAASAQVLKNGLWLLGIEVPDRM
ncbi:MAG: arginine--tRNA ligase [Candidatus Pacebacteria bacterium]|nr:arginine--tRNA ligase [Candidatus Paceibacterota bacterium]